MDDEKVSFLFAFPDVGTNTTPQFLTVHAVRTRTHTLKSLVVKLRDYKFWGHPKKRKRQTPTPFDVPSDDDGGAALPDDFFFALKRTILSQMFFHSFPAPKTPISTLRVLGTFDFFGLFHPKKSTMTTVSTNKGKMGTPCTLVLFVYARTRTRTHSQSLSLFHHPTRNTEDCKYRRKMNPNFPPHLFNRKFSHPVRNFLPYKH